MSSRTLHTVGDRNGAPWRREGQEHWPSTALSPRSETEARPLSSAGKNPR